MQENKNYSEATSQKRDERDVNDQEATSQKRDERDVNDQEATAQNYAELWLPRCPRILV